MVAGTCVPIPQVPEPQEPPLFSRMMTKKVRAVRPVPRGEIGGQDRFITKINGKWILYQNSKEPVHSEDDIIKFCEETSLPVALDETIDHIQGDPLNKLMTFVHLGIVVVVIIKPGVVEGV